MNNNNVLEFILLSNTIIIPNSGEDSKDSSILGNNNNSFNVEINSNSNNNENNITEPESAGS